MTRLEAAITDLEGTVLNRVWDFSGVEVTDPLNDAITGKLTLRTDSESVNFIRPGDRMIQVAYGNKLAAWGVVMKPVWDFDSRKVEVNFLSRSALMAKKHYHKYGDFVVDGRYPLDGRGMKYLLESVLPSPAQLSRGFIHPGFIWGYDNTTHQPAEDDGGYYRSVRRGTNVWESLTNLSQIGRIVDEDGNTVVQGPDFRFRPIHPDVLSAAEIYEFFDVWDRKGDDLRDTVIFQHGFGTESAENISYEPDFDSVRNYMVVVEPGGESSRTDDRVGRFRNEDSMEQYGMMEGWESGGQRDTQAVLKSKARGYVQAYAEPPDYFTVTPAIDRNRPGTSSSMGDPGYVPRYLHDYEVGDTIAAQVKRDQMEVNLVGRIVSCTMSQVNADGLTRTSISCVPTVDPDLLEGSSG